jgi:hypothetical protein
MIFYCFGSRISLMFLPCSFLSRLLLRPSPSAFLIPQQGGIPLQAGLQATDQPSRESRRRPRPPRSLNAAKSCSSTSSLHLRRSSNSLTLRFVTSLDSHWMLGDCQALWQCRDSCHAAQFEACQGMPQCVYPESHV